MGQPTCAAEEQLQAKMEQEMAAARAQPENDEDFDGVTASYVRALVQGQECERTQQRIQVLVSRLDGVEHVLQVEPDCSLHDFKRLLVKNGLAREGLAVEMILEGVPLSQERSSAPLSELNVVDGSRIMVITRRCYDYSQISEVQCKVQSPRWPQGVLTTTEGNLYVCCFQGELQVYDLELRLLREAKLPGTAQTPSQMAFASNGDIVLACSHPALAVVVDAPSLKVKRTLQGATGQPGKCCGIAIRGEEVFVSHMQSGVVSVLDFASGKLLRELNGFSRPSGMCAFDGGLLVADRADVVWLVRDDGSRQEIGRGLLKHPNDVAVDLSGNILVMDTGNERVAAFRADGSLTCGILPGAFKDFGNTHSYISVNPVNGTISVSMDDAHYIAILAPAVQCA